MSDCWRTAHSASLSQPLEAGLGDPPGDDDAVRLGLRETEAGGLARLDSADLEVAALDEPECVVELDLVGLQRALGVAGPGEQRGPATAATTASADSTPPHSIGPVARWASTQSSSFCSASLQTFEPSSAGSSLAPGQRLTWRSLAISRNASALSGSGSSRSGRPSETVNALKYVCTRLNDPSASYAPVCEKSSNQPNRSVVYGRPWATIGALPVSASSSSGKAPRRLPTSTGPVPKSILRGRSTRAMSLSPG